MSVLAERLDLFTFGTAATCECLVLTAKSLLSVRVFCPNSMRGVLMTPSNGLTDGSKEKLLFVNVSADRPKDLDSLACCRLGLRSLPAVRGVVSSPFTECDDSRTSRINERSSFFQIAAMVQCHLLSLKVVPMHWLVGKLQVAALVV